MRNLLKSNTLYFVAILIITGVFILQSGCSEDSPSATTKKGPQVVLSPVDALYFGQIPQGQSATRVFLIYNTGDEPLVISKMTVEGADASLFTLLDTTSQLTVPINKINSFAVRFDPMVAGNFNARVLITSNAGTSPDEKDLEAIANTGAGGITFERIIGEYGNDSGGKIRLLDDGGFIIAGGSYNKSEDATLATLFRLDQYGNLLWSEQYPLAGLSSFGGLVVTSNGNFVCTGTTRTNAANLGDVFSLSTDPDGNLLWQEIYELGGIQEDLGNDIIKTTHGGYLICGTTYNTDPATGGVRNALLIKIDNSGARQWHKQYGTTEGEEANSVKQLQNGGYIFAGSTSVPSEDPTGDFDFFLVKTDEDGNQLWAKNYGGGNYDFATSVIIDQPGGYVLAGYTASYGSGARDYWLLKTDTSGTEQWNKTYGGPENDSVSEIIQTSDDGFYLIGSSASFTVGENGQPNGQIWIIKTDNNGNVDWDELYGGAKGDGAASALELNDGYIISGGTSSFGGDRELYVLRTRNDGSIE